MSRRDIIVIGASSGGIEALRTLVGDLSPDFTASILIVQHTSPQSPGVLASILDRAGALPASNASDKEPIQPGHIYVAPPDYHLIIEPGIMRISRGPKENRFRPAIDPLFRSAAQIYGPRAIGVILTGNLDDGTAGLYTIKQLGGTAIVQDPKEAPSPSMPLSALSHVKVDFCVTLREIAPLLAQLTFTSAEEKGVSAVPKELGIEVKIAKAANAIEAGVQSLGTPSSFTCPECHGSLLQIKEGARFRFRCHTGHAYSFDSLLAELSERIEESLWITIRSIEESALMLHHLSEHLIERNQADAAQLMQEKSRAAHERANQVRQIALNHEKLSEEKFGLDGQEV